MSTEVHGRRRVWRWIKRGTLGLLTFVVLVVAGVLVTIHTDWGRNKIRGIVEAQLNNTFVGGATIGRLEGSPFGELVARDVVINGPDRQPAITVKTLRLEISLMPLLDKWAKLDAITVEDLDVLLKRDPDGSLQIARLMKPSEEKKSGWSVEIPDLEIQRGHIWLDNGAGKEPVNVDKFQLAAALKMPFEQPIDATVQLVGTWRERGTDIDLDAVLRSGTGLVKVDKLDLEVGAITVAASEIHVVTPEGQTLPSIIEGKLAVNAPKAEIERLVPTVEVPADIALQVSAHKPEAQPWTQIALAGQVGGQRIDAKVDADLALRRAKGTLSTGRLDLTMLTEGKIQGEATTQVTFDATAPEPGRLPVGAAKIDVAGDFEGAPGAKVAISASSTGELANAAIDVDGRALTATINAQVRKLGDAFELENARIIAKTTSPSKATGGKAPVHGSFTVDLTASGALSPKPALAVAGRIDGQKLRVQDLRVGSLKLVIDAKQLPAMPMGKVSMKARNIQRGTTYLSELDVDAANRDDGKIQVSMRTKPKQGPWLLEADALVDPAARKTAQGNTITVQLQKHHVRAGQGADWRGSSGFIIIAPDRFELADLSSKTDGGAVSAAGIFYRTGSRQGDVVAKVDVDNFELDNVSKAYRGYVNAKVDISRKNGRLAGTAEVKASGVSIDPRTLTYEVEAKVDAAADKLVVNAKAGSAVLGSALLDLDIDAPKDIADVAAWRTLGRASIRQGRVQLQGLNVKQLADLAGQVGEHAGRIDGDIQISSTTTGGTIQVRGLNAPAIRELRGVDADLNISQTERDLIVPTLIARVADIGAVTASATLHIPDRVFDPAAWKAKGRGALHGAYVKAENIEIAPGLLDRFNVKTPLRGRVSVTAEVTEALQSAKLTVAMRQLRGAPVHQPVDVDFLASIDDSATLASMKATSQGTTLLDMTTKIPVTLAQIEADPKVMQLAPLKVTARLPDVPAPKLMAVFGRSEITGGRISGTIDVGGTVGKPTVRARIAGTGLAVPPGPRNTPIQTIERLVIDGSWDGTIGKLRVDGTQERGTLSLAAEGNPAQLDKASVRLQAKEFDLVPLLAFAPGPAGGAAGRLDANLSMIGLDPRSAKLAGELHLRRGRIPLAPSIGTLRRASIDVVVREKDIALNIDGRLGGGTIKGNGSIAIQGAMPIGGTVKLALRKVSPIGVIEPIVDADVETKLRNDGDKWIADVAIRNGVVKVSVSDRGTKLDPAGAPPDMRFLDGSRVTERPMDKEKPPAVPLFVANIRIYSTYVESKEFRSMVKGAVTIESDGQALGIVGSIDASDRGELELFGRRYNVERAGVRFDGSNDPLLDLRITHDFAEVTTITEVRGRASKPDLLMSSNPGTYSQGQLLGFLLGGEPDGDPQASSFKDAATSAGTSFVANKIGGFVKGALPIDLDVLKYESASASSSAAIKVGTWLTRSLFVAYRRRLDARADENTGEGQVEYWLTRRIMLEGVAGDRGVSGLDLLWRRRY